MENLNRLKAVLADAGLTNKWLAEQLGNHTGRLLLVTTQKPRLWKTTKPPTSRRELIVLV